MVLALPILFCACLFPGTAMAAGSSQAITQGFQAKSLADMVSGAIVSTTSGNPGSVELATTASAGRLAGVVDKTPIINLAGNSAGVQVVLSGTTNVLVSNINGPIGAGDKITPSPIAGVGMRATSDGQVVGTADAAFTSRDAQTKTVKDLAGKPHVLQIGYIQLRVGIATYQAPGSDFLPPFLQRMANAIAGQQVSLIRILFSAALVLASFIGMSTLIYTSSKSAMISLGRNPLAAHDIRRSLYQVIGVAGSALGVSVLIAYIVLIT
ncbi:MAG TPA: hypothetical protein VLF40_00220 [Candidatus Saccharimonadales bacterium]|nr:hypothetical protein [Candidatus Saccharimonadales bacterium]